MKLHKRIMMTAAIAIMVFSSVLIVSANSGSSENSSVFNTDIEQMYMSEDLETAAVTAEFSGEDDYYGSGHFESAAEIIEDLPKAEYIDDMIDYYISSNQNLQDNLKKGFPVIMLFEGGSDNPNRIAEGYRDMALCLVIRYDEVGNSPYISYFCKNCTTMPDYPMSFDYNNGHDGYGTAILTDGIYNIYTRNHRDTYAGFNVRTASYNSVPCVYMKNDGTFSILNGTGINIHTRLMNTVSGNESAPFSAGCLLIGDRMPFDAYREFLQNAVPDTSLLTEIIYNDNVLDKYSSGESVPAGMIVVDRNLAKDILDVIYDDSEAVERITMFSTLCRRGEENKSAEVLNEFTFYPSYLNAEAEAGRNLTQLPFDDSVIGYTDGSELTVTGIYENNEGEYSYRVYTNEGTYYIDAEDVISTETVYSDISIHNYNYPEVKEYKKAFGVYGIIAKTYNNLDSVEGFISNMNDEVESSAVVSNILSSYSLDGSDYWLDYKSSLDYRLGFGGLSIGNHKYQISATVKNYYVSNGKLEYESNKTVLVDKVFRTAPSVTFDANGGETESTVVLADEDGFIPEIPVPVYENHTFTGWYDSEGNEINEETVINKNITATAKWTENTVLTADNSKMSADKGSTVKVTVTLLDSNDEPVSGVNIKSEYCGNIQTEVTGSDGKAVFNETAQSGRNEIVFIFEGSDSYTRSETSAIINGTDSSKGGGNVRPSEKTAEDVGEAVQNKSIFEDVKPSDYFYDSVVWATDNNIVKGIDAAHFAPKDKVTRAQMLVMLWRAAGSPEPQNAVNKFTDVAKGSYYEKALLWALEKGIVKGTSESTFGPKESVTRGQAAVFIYRFIGGTGISSSGITFNDVSKDSWYHDAVIELAELGVVEGTSDTGFSPDKECTRGEAIELIYRTSEKISL